LVAFPQRLGNVDCTAERLLFTQQLLERIKVALMQCLIVITHRQESRIVAASPQFLLQELDEDS